MNDLGSFVEQITVKRPDAGDTAKRLLIILGGSIISALAFFIAIQVMPVLVMISIGTFYLMYRLLTDSFIEYEYIVTNNELDIDKIKGKRKRKRLITIKINTAEEWGEYENYDIAKTNVSATVAAHNNSGSGVWYLLAAHEKHGKVLLIFSPNDKVKSAINRAVPHRLRFKELPKPAPAGEDTETTID